MQTLQQIAATPSVPKKRKQSADRRKTVLAIGFPARRFPTNHGPFLTHCPGFNGPIGSTQQTADAVGSTAPAPL
ncbi:MAG: hypothetical protein IID39_03215 [Planctomycetes bacterium]|nr:hypothetical protein [Planctomycetota bacterium]